MQDLGEGTDFAAGALGEAGGVGEGGRGLGTGGGEVVQVDDPGWGRGRRKTRRAVGSHGSVLRGG